MITSHKPGLFLAPETAQVGRGCLHADFANKSLGGGVLVGGCVQEEILGTSVGFRAGRTL